MENIVSLISQVGFPMALSVYLIVKFEKSIKENTKMGRSNLEATQKNIEVTKRLSDLIKSRI